MSFLHLQSNEVALTSPLMIEDLKNIASHRDRSLRALVLPSNPQPRAHSVISLVSVPLGAIIGSEWAEAMMRAHHVQLLLVNQKRERSIN